MVRAGLEALPAIVRVEGERASRRFIEFFTATIRNRNTRLAYARAAKQFFDWCDDPPAETSTSGYRDHAHTTARSLARLYGALTRGGEVDGYRIVRPEALERFWAEQSFGADQVLMQCWSAEPAWHDAGVEQQRRMARWDNATQRCVDRYGCRR